MKQSQHDRRGKADPFAVKREFESKLQAIRERIHPDLNGFHDGINADNSRIQFARFLKKHGKIER